jgi:hypothetical protein
MWKSYNGVLDKFSSLAEVEALRIVDEIMRGVDASCASLGCCARVNGEALAVAWRPAMAELLRCLLFRRMPLLALIDSLMQRADLADFIFAANLYYREVPLWRNRGGDQNLGKATFYVEAAYRELKSGTL